MISLIVLICALKTHNLSCILIVFLLLFCLWAYIISVIRNNTTPNYHSIDNYMDKNYGDINWLKNKKL